MYDVSLFKLYIWVKKSSEFRVLLNSGEKMPPVYVQVTPKRIYDGLSPLDFRSEGLNFLYFPNFVNPIIAACYYRQLAEKDSCLNIHSYVGQFNRIITPKRYTFALVPGKHELKFRGKPVFRREDPPFQGIFQDLVSSLPPEFLALPDASIVNGYRYNGIDNIMSHVDNEKFLMKDNTSYFEDESAVATVTLLRHSEKPMIFYAGDSQTGEGIGVQARHGSLIVHGAVLHEIRPVKDTSQSSETIGRISITLRKIGETCHHSDPVHCLKPNCPRNLGPSNYLYYSNKGSTTPSN
jgi:hypothetical protein